MGGQLGQGLLVPGLEEIRGACDPEATVDLCPLQGAGGSAGFLPLTVPGREQGEESWGLLQFKQGVEFGAKRMCSLGASGNPFASESPA